MSVHFSWSNWLEAIKNNDVQSVENGLFYLDDKVHKPYALLEGGLDSLMLAAKLGYKQIVKILLDDRLNRVKSQKQHECDVDGLCSGGMDESMSSVLENAGKLHNFGNAVQTACRYGQLTIVEMLFTYEDQFTGNFLYYYSEQLTQNSTSSGNFKLVSFLMDKFRNNKDANEKMPVIIDVLISTILQHGHQHLSELDEHVRKDPLYMCRLAKIHPLHRAILMGDLKILKRLLNKYKDWTNIKYPDKDDRWCKSMDVFQLTAAIGDTECMEYLYIAASKIETCNVQLLLEGACNKACQQGRKHVIELCLRKGWLQKNYIHGWSLMLKHVLWADQVEIVNFILDKFLLKIEDKQKSFIVKSINDKEFAILMGTPMENWSNRPQILQKLSRNKLILTTITEEQDHNNNWKKTRGKNSRRQTKQSSKIPDIVFECLMTAILQGSPESVKMYFEMIPETEIRNYMKSNLKTRMMKQNHCRPIAELWRNGLADRDNLITGEVDYRKSIVVAEMLRPYSSDSLEFFLEASGDFEDWPTLMAFLLQDPACAGRLNIKQLMKQMTDFMSESPDGYSHCIRPFDYFDVTPIQKYVFTFDESGHAHGLANICKMFTMVCGTKQKSVLWDGLLYETLLNLDQEYCDILTKFIINSGIIILDTDLEICPEYVKTKNTYEGFKELTRFHSTPDKIGLKALCRIAIRRTVRQTSLKVESLTDRLLKLEIEGLLPKPLVSYLLFRPELKELPCINIKVAGKRESRFVTLDDYADNYTDTDGNGSDFYDDNDSDLQWQYGYDSDDVGDMMMRKCSKGFPLDDFMNYDNT